MEIETKGDNIDGSTYNQEQDDIIIELLKIGYDLKRNGVIQTQPDILLITNYRADKAILEEMMEREALEGNIKLSTVDSAMGQTGTMVIWGTGKTGKRSR